MLRRFANLSIRSKLTLIVMISTGAALTIASVAWVALDQMTFRKWMSHYAQSRAAIIADNSVVALSFDDPQEAMRMLETFGADPHLGSAAVLNPQGEVFAQYIRPGWEQSLPVSSPSLTPRFTADCLEIFEPVIINGQHGGLVVLQVDLDELRNRFWSRVLAATLVLFAASVVGWLFSSGLRRAILQPIELLLQTVHVVAEQKDYSVRVAKLCEDELGQLTDGFNEMLSQIGTRDAALQEAQADLEEHVMLRTTELHESNESLTREANAHKQARDESDALRLKLETAYQRVQREATERSQVQEALRRSEERFSKAFRASPVPLAILTRNSRVFVDVNDRFAELAGRKREQIIGEAVFALPVWSLSETRARVEQVMANGQALRNWECRIIRSADQPQTALLSAEAFMLGSEPCVLLMTEDISERVNLETQLRQAQKMEAIGQLASGVAHDFNNLLTIIQGYTQIVLAMQSTGAVVRDALEKVTGATQRAAQLTGQLLTFSRKQVAQLKSLDLNQVITNVSTMLRPLLGENIKLNWQPNHCLPQVQADSGMLEQVMVNLAVNARDAMTNGGELVISTFVCDIDASYLQYHPQASAGQFVCLQVSDSGCGMEAAILERIFEPFFTTKDVGKGTGLGLATVYAIVKQHRGWIEVASQVGVGTTFKVYLPAAVAESGNPEVDGDATGIRGGHELIMVVEDETVLRGLVTQILRSYGYQVVEASHGHEALQVWRHAARKPALLLTDLMMPEGMTGCELAERLRVDTPSLKVVFTSGYSTELLRGQVQSSDRSNFLPKPFHPRVLAKTVRQCLDNN